MTIWNAPLFWVLLASMLMFVGSIVVAWALIARMPADYLTRDRESFLQQHPLLRVLSLVIKNASGLVLLVAGLVMLFTPGQGLLLMFLGLTLISFPGKRQLIHHMVAQKSILRLLNKTRERAGRPPLEVPTREAVSKNR